MIRSGEVACPHCGGDLKHYDWVKRQLRAKNRALRCIKIRRFGCVKCRKIHRALPDCVFPYKHYEMDIIMGVLDGRITSATIEYEDYPCEITMARWKTQQLHITRFK